jgi:hypothetical protein
MAAVRRCLLDVGFGDHAGGGDFELAKELNEEKDKSGCLEVKRFPS